MFLTIVSAREQLIKAGAYPKSPPAPDVYDLREAVTTCLVELSERERAVLMMRFGFDGQGGMTREEVGDYFGVTRERIRQVEAKAIRKLRRWRLRSRLKPFIERTDIPVTLTPIQERELDSRRINQNFSSARSKVLIKRRSHDDGRQE